MDQWWDEAAIDLYARFRGGQLTPDDMVVELPQIWRTRDRQDPLDSDAAWREMVEYAGYFTWRSGWPGGRRARRPWRRLPLYRGASPQLLTRDPRTGLRPSHTATSPIPPGGFVIDAGGGTDGHHHVLLADGPVFAERTDRRLRHSALLTVPAGSIAYLAHPDHAYIGIGAGTYYLHQQRDLDHAAGLD